MSRGRGSKAGRRRRRPASAAAVLLLLGGCAGEAGFSGDPLTGGVPRPTRPTAAATDVAAAGAPAKPAAAAGTAALPAKRDSGGTAAEPPAKLEPGSGTNLAALTTGAYVPPDTRREPRPAGAALPPPPPADGNKPLWNDKEAVAAAPGKGPVLREPQPAGGTPPSPVPLSPTQPPVQPGVLQAGGTLRADTLEQAKVQLAARGVTYQKMEGLENGTWHFLCNIPRRDNPSVQTVFEVTERSELAAVRAVLEQIDRERP